MISNLPTLRTPALEPARCGLGLGTLRAWLRDRRERHLLATLDDHVLADIGLCRADIERECRRPVWERIDYAALEVSRWGPRLRR